MATEQEIGVLVTKFIADLTGLQQGVDEYGKQMDKAQEKTKGLNADSINLAASIANFQSLTGYAKKALTLYTDAFTEAYGQVETFNRITGTTVDQGGKWLNIMEKNSLEMGSLTYAFRALSNNMQQAESPTSKAAGAFKTLGVEVRDASGNMRDSNTVALELMTALAKVQNAAERSALAQAVFGRGQQAINKLWADGKDMMEIYEAEETKMTANGMYSYKQYTKAMGELNSAQGDLLAGLGEGLIPMFTRFVTYLTDHVIPAIDRIGDALGFFGWRLAALKDAVAGNITWGDFEKVSQYGFYKQAQFLDRAKASDADKAKWIEDQNALKPEPEGFNPAPWDTGAGGSAGSAEEEWLLEQGEVGIRSYYKMTPALADKYIMQYRKIVEGRVAADLEEMNAIQRHLKDHVKDVEIAERDKEMLLRKGYQTAVDIARTQNKELIAEWNKLAKEIQRDPIYATIQINTKYTTTGAGAGQGPEHRGWSRGGTAWDSVGVGAYDSEMYIFMKSLYNAGYTYQESLRYWMEGAPPPDVIIGTGGIKSRAGGGSVISGLPYLVGEAGPEIFEPEQNGVIFPNGVTGGTANIYVELDGETIAKRIAAPLVGEIRVRTGVKL